jgi:hypothetical protein
MRKNNGKREFMVKWKVTCLLIPGVYEQGKHVGDRGESFSKLQGRDRCVSQGRQEGRWDGRQGE